MCAGSTPMTQKRVLPIDRSTASHHAIITLAIGLFAPTLPHILPLLSPSGGSRKSRRPVNSTFVHDRPGDARRLVGNGDRNKLGGRFGEQPGDPGMLVRMTPGVVHDGRC